ncbi:MAG: UDP-2,4-diacetamido-2,4,6-trideoxy-beta-L-altropyranose hydrolase [Peptococcaceae bacterium]|jgi:UDP-2,4-diacetamido-2,4,6-trideoxy-beta-L-altropyranose hydrolase|nr:UDP-2,4-diacetamido-2,4,6-trideoxy-beta-L-altropyranose hydrolase [Peptococcaceae bacterium]
MHGARLEKPGNLVLFRADGGPQIGMGHVVRCLALACALDLPAVFLSRPDGATETMVCRAGFEYLALEESVSWSLLAEKLQPAVLVVDTYRISGEELAAIKMKVPVVVVIDDLNDHHLPAHILINGNITAPGLGYPPDKVLLLGPEYVLLRHCFRGLSAPAVPATARKILVTAGGGDPGGATPRILAQLTGLDLHLRVALGPQFKTRAELETWIGNISSTRGQTVVELLDNPDMAELMVWADLALSTGGSTLYELCAAGTPALAVAVAGNQVASAAALGELGCIAYLGRLNGAGGEQGTMGLSFPDLRQAVQALAADPVRRAVMSRRGQSLVDGRGAERCAAVIKTMMK